MFLSVVLVGGKKKDIFTNFAHNSQRMVMKTTDIYSGVNTDFNIALSLHELHDCRVCNYYSIEYGTCTKKIVFLSFFFISMNFEKNNLEIIGFPTGKQISKYFKAIQWEK